MRFILCGGRLRVDVVELGDEMYEVFVFVGNGLYDVVDVLEREGFVYLVSEGRGVKVMSKVVNGDVIDYVSELSVIIAKEMKKWREC
jgi:hypothetical protein